MSKIFIIPPSGHLLRDTRTGLLHSEVVTEARNQKYFVVADSDEDPIVQEMSGGTTLQDRVSEIETAVRVALTGRE